MRQLNYQIQGVAENSGSEHSPREEIMVSVNGKRVPFADLPALISVPTAGEILGLTRATAYRYAAAGGLPIWRFGARRLYVVKAKLRELLEPDDQAAA
jgi:excisionase family DNA binding protein